MGYGGIEPPTSSASGKNAPDTPIAQKRYVNYKPISRIALDFFHQTIIPLEQPWYYINLILFKSF